MYIQRKNGATSNIVRCRLLNSSTGQGLTGLTNSSTGLIISTICDNEPSATTYTVASSNVETITTLGTYAAPTSGKCRFKEVDSTNHPGLYELQFADARFAVSSAKVLRISITGATNLLTKSIVVQLTAYDPDDATSLGLSRIDAAITSRLAPTTAGRTLDVSAGGEAGVDWANVGSPTTTLNLSGTTISTSQAVASVSGAVGSVTGNVGGNIVGSVGSVTGNVGGNVGGSVGSISGVSFPANFSALVISVGGAVTVGTNNDKTGYSLTQAFPSNFASLGINTSGHVSRVTLVDTTTTNTDMITSAGIRTAVGLATNNLDTQIATLATASNLAIVAGYLDTEIAAILADTNELQTDLVNGGRLDLLIDAIKAKTDNLPAAPAATGDIPTANANADAVLDRASAIDGKTLREALRIIAAGVLGKVSGAGTSTEVFVGLDGATTRATVTADADGNRTAVTYG